MHRVEERRSPVQWPQDHHAVQWPQVLCISIYRGRLQWPQDHKKYYIIFRGHLQSLVEDFHVQQAEEPTPQPRPQRAVARLALPHNIREEDSSGKGLATRLFEACKKHEGLRYLDGDTGVVERELVNGQL